MCPDGKLLSTGDSSSRGTSGRGRPTIHVTVMNTDASRIKGMATISGSRQFRQTASMIPAMTAVTMILTNVSASIAPAVAQSSSVGVRRSANHRDTSWSARLSAEFSSGPVSSHPMPDHTSVSPTKRARNSGASRRCSGHVSRNGGRSVVATWA